MEIGNNQTKILELNEDNYDSAQAIEAPVCNSIFDENLLFHRRSVLKLKR
jgi:hypothetical protein